MNISDIFSNPWVVGIGGGILSSLIVTLLTRALLSGRDKREFAQTLSTANREIVYAVRPSIPEGIVPNADLLDALVRATARKYGVNSKDLYQPHEVAQDLIKEVMDSSFISAKTKEEYCSRLIATSKPSVSNVGTATMAFAESRSVPALEEYRSRLISMMSLMMGILAGATTLLLSFSKQNPFEELLGRSGSGLAAVLGPAILITVALGLPLFAMFTFRYVRNLQEKRDQPERREKKPNQDG